MATNRSEVVTFEFATNGTIVGRATWLAPGMVELDFEDGGLRRRFERFFGERQEHLGAVFDGQGDLSFHWRDESSARFAEACWAMANYYKVRRVQ